MAIGTLAEHVDSFKDLRKSIEPMLQTYVFKELSSSEGLLQSRAFWLYGEYGYIKIKEQEHVNAVLNLILQGMQSESLPIKLQSAITLHKFISEKDCKNELKPRLGDLLRLYLKIMQEVDSEELVAALEEIVDTFSEDIGPFAEDLCTELINSYHKLVNQDDDDGESSLAAMGCVTAIRRVLNSAQDNKELLSKLEEKVYPVILFSITPEGLDSIEDGLDCATILLYYKEQNQVGEKFWRFFPDLVYLVCGKEDDPDSGYGFEFTS